MKTTMRYFAMTLALMWAVAGCDPAAESNASGEKETETGESESAEKADESKAGEQKADDEADEKEEKSAEKSEEGDDTKILGRDGTPDDQKKGQTRQYGAKFSVDGEPTTLSSVLDSIDPKDDEKSKTDKVKVSADIEKVCKKKGCWFTLAADGVDRTVRVKMKDYGFFVPRNTGGGDAVIEGTLQARKMSEKEAKHYAKDEGKDPKEVTEQDRYVYEFTASAVQITL